MNLKNPFRLSQEQRFLFGVLKPYRLVAVSFLLASLLASLCDGISIGLLIPLLSHLQDSPTAESLPRMFQWMVRPLLPYSVQTRLMLSVGFVILVVLLKNIVLALAFRQGVWLSNRVCADIRLKVVNLLLRVGMGFHHSSRAGELLDKSVNYTYCVKDLLSFFVQFIVFALMCAILLVLMVVLSWPLTLLALVLGMVAMVVASAYIRTISRYGERQALVSRELTAEVQENLSAVQLIKTYSKERHQYEKLAGKIESYAEADNRMSCRVFWSQPITEGLGVVVIGGILVGSHVVMPGNSMLLPQLLPFLYILLRIATMLKLLNEIRGRIKARLPHLRLVHDLVREDNKPMLADGHKVFPGLDDNIAFHGVSFGYEDSTTVLRDLSFAIPQGQTTAIVGASGTGKSTIVSLFLRFYDPQRGTIVVDGRPLKDFQLASYHRRIGVVSQETFIFHDTIRYNIMFSMTEPVSDEKVVDAAKRAGAHDFIAALPRGYDTVLGDRGVTLSGGQRQRIAIARALLKDPEILILDEATSALDTITERRIHEAISELQRDRTVVIIAHRLSTVRNADQIIVLKNGTIAEIGSPKELLKNGQEYFKLVQGQ